MWIVMDFTQFDGFFRQGRSTGGLHIVNCVGLFED
jgi:hypothetical protein